MDQYLRPYAVIYKRWRDDSQREQERDVDHSDESQFADSDSVTSVRVDLPRGQTPASHGAPETEETYTVEAAMEALGFGVFQWKLTFITALAWIVDAMELMILSILGPQLLCEWRLHSYQTALLTSVVFLGMALGCPLWGIVNDKYGRKTGIILPMAWTLFYGLLCAFVPVYGWLLVLRGLVGFGIGGAPQALTYYAEFLPTKWRGICLMLFSMFWGVGTTMEVLLASWIMPTLGWRWLLGLSSLPMAFFLCFWFWLPESPRFDLLAGNRERAMRTLTSIAKQNGKVLPPGKIVAYKQNNRGQFSDLFTPQYRRTTLLLLVVWFAGAFSYFGIILLTSEMFQSGVSCGETQTGKSENSCSLECKSLTFNDYKDILMTTLAEIPGSLVNIIVLQCIGRKKTMALSFVVFSLSLLPLFACIGRTALSIFLFIARGFINGGYQVTFVYTPEVFPTETRALAMGTTSMMSKVGALITPFVAQVLLKTSLNLTTAVYTCCSAVAAILCLILPVETSGRGLSETPVDQEEVTTTSEMFYSKKESNDEETRNGT